MKTVVNSIAVSELTLYAENTKRVYDFSIQVIANLKEKFKKAVAKPKRL